MNDKTLNITTGLRVVSVALLVVLILLAISATATAKGKPGGGTDPSTIELTASGVLIASQSCQEKLSASSSDVLCNKRGYQIMLGDFFVNRNYVNGHGGECFAGGIWDVTFGAWEDRDGSAGAILRWHAYDTMGVEVLYALEVYGSNWSSDFPPLSPGTISMQGSEWLLRTGNKRQSRYACVAEGGFGGDDTLTVNFIRLN